MNREFPWYYREIMIVNANFFSYSFEFYWVDGENGTL